jgi:hypothetical protein
MSHPPAGLADDGEEPPQFSCLRTANRRWTLCAFPPARRAARAFRRKIMTQSGETDHDKELQKAFAEFKESLRHDAHGDSAPKLSAPEIVVAEPRRPAAAQPKIDTRPVLGSIEPHVEKSIALAPVTKPASGGGRRRGLLYLSAAIIVTGLGALGWTLTHGARTADPTAAVAPEAPAATEAATTPETATTAAEAPASEVPAAEAPQAAAAPATPAATPEQPPAAQAQPAAEKADLTPPKAAEPAPAAAAAAQAPVQTPPPKAAVKETTTPPATPAQADAAAAPKPKTPAKPKVVKAKPKPAPTQSASRPAATTPEPAPVAEAAPPSPPPPPQSDGALGFVKRTVNSVGSTISNIGRGATGN